MIRIDYYRHLLNIFRNIFDADDQFLLHFIFLISFWENDFSFKNFFIQEMILRINYYSISLSYYFLFLFTYSFIWDSLEIILIFEFSFYLYPSDEMNSKYEFYF